MEFKHHEPQDKNNLIPNLFNHCIELVRKLKHIDKMKTNAIIFIFTRIIYNFIDLGNDNYHFIDGKFLDDVWYVLIYGHLSFLFYNYRKSNIYGNLAYKAAIGSLIYNFGIMINLITYTQYQSTFFVPCFIVVLLILENTKWLLYRLRR